MQAPGPGTKPTIDGKWSAGEWDDAFEYSATNSTLTSYIRVKWNGPFLYILIDSPWDTTNSSVYPYENTWIAFDTGHDKSTVGPQPDDYLFTMGSLAPAYSGNGTWISMAVPSGFKAESSSSAYGPGVQPSPKNATPHRIDEFKIPLTYVGQINQTSGFYFMVIDDINDPDGTGPKGSPTYVEWPENSGGSSDGWPPDGRDPCPAPNAWGHLTFLQRPTASFTYSPDIPDLNETVTFDASASQDPDGSIINYTWDFGDGNVTTVNVATITHAFSVSGSYDVNLTVTDNDGLNGSVAHTVTVGIRAAFTFSPPAPNPGDVVTFNATTSYSRRGTIINYTWNFNDGNITTVNATTITHIFSTGGSYDVNLTVTDDTGLKAWFVDTVNVGVPVANFTFWPSKPNKMDAVIFNATASSDPDGTIVNYTWNFDDGSIITVNATVITHTFSANRSYTVNLTVTDNLGLNRSVAHNVTIYAARKARFSFSPSTPNVGDVVTFNASLSEDPGGTIVNYTWDFDDDNIITVNATVITHTFSANGSYNVNLTITDNDGLKSWYNNTVNVGIPPFLVTAPFSPMIPTIDGIWNPGEWDDANEYEITGLGGTGYVRIKHNNTHLHIIIDSPWDTTNASMSAYENAFIAFDTGHDKSTVGPQPDDYLFNNVFSQWNVAWKGNGITWAYFYRTEIDYIGMGYTAMRENGPSPKNATMHRIDEFRIPLDFVGNPTSGFYIIVVDDSSDPDRKWGPNLPPTAWVEWPTGAGGDPRGWPMGDDYIDPCPTPDKWGYLFLEPSTKAFSNVTLDISSSSITLGENVTISGTVSKSTGAIAGVDVTIQYKLTGAMTWTNATTVTTNSTGGYTYAWTPTEAGTYEIKASWAGDADTYGAESEEKTLEVAPKQEVSKSIPFLVIVVALAVVAVVVAIAVYLFKVRKPKR
ncbi:MAG: PKD domain-containing protein [Candidatus Bathyarchaeia archaeon]